MVAVYMEDFIPNQQTINRIRNFANKFGANQEKRDNKGDIPHILSALKSKEIRKQTPFTEQDLVTK